MQYDEPSSSRPLAQPAPRTATSTQPAVAAAAATVPAATPRVQVKKEPPAEDRIGRIQAAGTSRRTVCDHCRKRRIRCDGQFPCQQCAGAALTCKRDHVPKKRGPKRGHGRVINELRAQEMKGPRGLESASGSDVDTDQFNSAPTSAAPSPPAQPFIPWATVTPDPRHVPEPKSAFTSDAYQPRTRDYLYLIPRCVELYYEHIYPIMPLLYMPTIRNTITRPMVPSEKNLIYALSALTAFHMAGKSLSAAAQPCWDEVGRFFLDECISIRQRYDFLEDTSLYAVISSFWLSTSFFEINQSRKSWFYLREALTLAIDLRLHDDAANFGLPPEEVLCRQRVFWILFVTERSFAILRNKPLTFRKTPSLPTTMHSYESPEIHIGFRQLVSSYYPLDESFVAAWNDGSDPRISKTTYMNLQEVLAQPLEFLRPKRKSPSPPVALLSSSASSSEEDPDEPDPTAIQKADLLITQQWLRLIVWQSSFRQGLLSTASSDESFSFSFPLSIARDTAAILQSIPSRAVEVHGMGIFEKIFEIGTWSVNVMGAYDSGTTNPSRPFGGAMDGVGGMDFVGGELSLFGRSGRSGAVLDPLEFFIKTLSASPNSQTMYADKLLLFAEQTPGGLRTNLSPVLPSFGRPSRQQSWGSTSSGVVGEVPDENGSDEILGSMDLGTDQLMNNGIGFPASSARGSVLGSFDTTSSDLGLSIVTTRSSGYSIPDGPMSAGLSTAFSDLSTGGDEYGFGSAFTSDMTGIESSRANSVFMTGMAAPWEHATDQGRKRGGQANGNGSTERIMGVW
ncbi:hypothetical protein JX265_009319 [Neoarthrinium moseri]|uniref:Zn(2)-C6 fungal-type domain-containing protein n=1 Tax=Neoarthrinium moseri TaxID=1658444 RepID=A0A9P9WGA9_9PEZI|nr:hypothetical protein JX265_009319 [Neoarthrinium moseri]